jgi:hypothetical protein
MVVIILVLAAFGMLCALWTLFGWLVRPGRGMIMVCLSRDYEMANRYHRTLQGLGLLDCPLIFIGDEPCPPGLDAEICTLAQLVARLEQERDG